MKVGRVPGFGLLLSSALAFAGPKKAPPPPSAPPPAAEEEFHWQLGPKPISLGHEVELTLPKEHAFLGMPEADKFLKKIGSFDNQGVLGVVVSADPNQQWGVGAGSAGDVDARHDHQLQHARARLIVGLTGGV